MDFGKILAIALEYGQYLLVALGALSAGLHVVAPFTKTNKDDDVANWADKVAQKLKTVVVPKKLK